MWTAVMTPWYRRASSRAGGAAKQPGSVLPTPILDHESSIIRALLSEAQDRADAVEPAAVLQAAHAVILERVRPVYALDESTPTSVTLSRGTGSCSQRLAILESVARSAGVETRVRALLIDRSFWFPRFPRIKYVLPPQIMIAWPEFLLDQWQSASRLFGSMSCRFGAPFANSGSETLFEAVARCAVDWDGYASGSASDLSRFVHADLGYFSHRDDLFESLGQTLCAPARVLADPVLRRIAA